LFNLSSFRQFTNTGKGRIDFDWCCGPIFRNKECIELSAYEPFNSDGACISYAKSAGYKIKYEGGINMLTNKENVKFTITELEVWQVSFINE
jgi:hypothetical protein